MQVVEFPSYEEAMANSVVPETMAFAGKLSALCMSGPTFRNLDLVRVDELQPAESARPGRLCASAITPRMDRGPRTVHPLLDHARRKSRSTGHGGFRPGILARTLQNTLSALT